MILTASELRDFAINRYFGAVDAKNLAGALDCFAPDANFSIPTGPANFSGKAEIGRMLVDYFAAHEVIRHHDFHVVVDVERQAVSAHFDGFLRTLAGEEIELHNTNIWQFENGLLSDVRVYMSGPNVLK